MKSVSINKLFKHLPQFSFILSLLCFLTVLCFLFPEYLTTPEIRFKYPIPLFRTLLYWSIMIGLLTGLYSVLFLQNKRYSLFAISLQFIVIFLGGSQVRLKEEYNSFTIRLGLDWLILDLLILAFIFIPLETFFPKYKNQKLVRPEVKTDLNYFVIGHLGFQIIALLTQKPADLWLEFLRFQGLKSYVSNLPSAVQILLALFIADMTQYWAHRLFHQNKNLWKFHKIHHSIKTLDWLAGSRLHIVDIIVVRTLVYIVVMYLGLSEFAFGGYILIMMLQTVFIHSNFGLNLGLLNYIITTPQYHHWHHNDCAESYDKNFAVHFPFIDMIFGTFYLPNKNAWPTEYGIQEDHYPDGYLAQTVYPFQN